jgi:phage regulator Rha-like protein
MRTALLSIQPSTEAPYEGFFAVLLDIIRKHPVLFTAFFMVPFLALLISLGLKWYYVFHDTTHYLSSFQIDGRGNWSDSRSYFSAGIDRYIRELDIAGLLGGIIGIFIGLYLTVTSEKGNRQKERLNQQEMEHLRAQTDLLVQATSSINSLVMDVSGKVNEKVQLMEGTGEVLKGIAQVVESAKSQGNDLLVLANTARIEGIAPFRMEYVAKHADLKPHELTKATQFDYARKAEALQRDCSDADNQLKEVALYLQAMNSDAHVEFVTLNDQAEGAAHPFLKYLGKVLNDFIVVDGYRSGSNVQLPLTDASVPHHNRFLVPVPATTEPGDLKGYLVGKLYEEHSQAIREMQELGIRVTKINKTMPVQLFISAPKENKPGLQRGKCVCILGSGSSASGRASKLTAFLTDDPHIVASMTELFYDYESDGKLKTQEFMRQLL